MQSWRRREFLGASLAGLASTSELLSRRLQGEDAINVTKTIAQNAPPAPDTLMLTWQSDPTTTMTVQWLNWNTSARNVVHFAEWGQPDWKQCVAHARNYQPTDLQLYRCEMTGLTPDTEYQFRVSGTGTIHRFRTMPAQATDVIQFVSGGDSGIGKAAIRINEIAARQEPRFALIGGDLAYDNGRNAEVFTKFLQNWHSQMVDSEGRLIPLLSCLGNHEVDGGYSTNRTDAPHYLSFFDGIYSETTYNVLDIGNYLSLVLLDSGHLSPITGEQTDWLERTLAARADRQHLIVAYHVPAYPSWRAIASKDGGQAQRESWCPLFERYKVDLVLEHHDHTFKRSYPLTNGLYDKHGVLYLGDGSWGMLRPLNTPTPRPYLAKVSSSNHVTVHRLEGDERFHTALDAVGKVTDVCHTVSKRPARRG